MRTNKRASGPVLTSRFLFVPDHSATAVYINHPDPVAERDDLLQFFSVIHDDSRSALIKISCYFSRRRFERRKCDRGKEGGWVMKVFFWSADLKSRETEKVEVNEDTPRLDMFGSGRNCREIRGEEDGDSMNGCCLNFPS